MFDAGFWKNKKVLLTGNTGFKGSWAQFVLQKSGAQVYGYSLPPQAHQKLYSILKLQNDSQQMMADICDLSTVKKWFHQVQPDVVIHMAAQPLVRLSYQEPLQTFATNIMGSAHILEACREINSIKSIVMITTDKVYLNEEKNRAFVEGDALGGKDPYSASKACSEIVTQSMAESFFKERKIIATTRAGNVIGGGDWSTDRLIPDVVDSLIKNYPVVIRNPKAIRPWQHVLEPVFGYLQIAQGLYQGRTELARAWNFGPDESDAQDVEKVVTLLNQIWGNGPGWKLESQVQLPEAQFLRLDTQAIKKALPWKPTWNLQKALEKTAQWYRCYHEYPEKIYQLSEEQISDFMKGS